MACVAAMGVAAVAAQGASVGDDPVGGCDPDHRRGAWLSVCRGGHAHGRYIQPRFGHRPHGQRLARGLRHSCCFDPTEIFPPEQSQIPSLSDQIHLSLHTNKPHRENGESGRPVLYALFRGRVLLLGVSLVSSK